MSGLCRRVAGLKWPFQGVGEVTVLWLGWGGSRVAGVGRAVCRGPGRTAGAIWAGSSGLWWAWQTVVLAAFGYASVGGQVCKQLSGPGSSALLPKRPEVC